MDVFKLFLFGEATAEYFIMSHRNMLVQTGRRLVSRSHLQENGAKRPLFIAVVCDSHFCTCALCL